jgi:hypothetical protein
MVCSFLQWILNPSVIDQAEDWFPIVDWFFVDWTSHLSLFR